MPKIILAIHGLGNKPPSDIMEKWWVQSIKDGFKNENYPAFWLRFNLIYWANFIHKTPLDPSVKDKSDPRYLEDPYTQYGTIKRGRREPLQKKIRDYIEKQMDKLLLNEDLTINFTKISDFIIHHFFHDLEIYYGSPSAKNQKPDFSARKMIRSHVLQTLKKYQNYEILLIAHSMGSIIAYDVLSQNQDEIKIHTLVTCGSPLGIPIIMNKIRLEQNIPVSQIKLKVPENITHRWYNLSDLHDRVALNYNLNDDYDKNSGGKDIEDLLVTNTYEINGLKNPHKAYGYLRTPEMAEILYEFLCQGRSPVMIWLMHSMNSLLKLFRGSGNK